MLASMKGISSSISTCSNGVFVMVNPRPPSLGHRSGHMIWRVVQAVWPAAAIFRSAPSAGRGVGSKNKLQGATCSGVLAAIHAAYKGHQFGETRDLTNLILRGASGYTIVSRLVLPHRVLLEQQRRKFVQATAPGQKLVSGPGRFVEEGVDTGCLEFFRSGFAWAAVFELSIAEEHHLDLLLEGGRILDFRQEDVAAAEQADVGELVEIGHGGVMGLPAEIGRGARR